MTAFAWVPRCHMPRARHRVPRHRAPLPTQAYLYSSFATQCFESLVIVPYRFAALQTASQGRLRCTGKKRRHRRRCQCRRHRHYLVLLNLHHRMKKTKSAMGRKKSLQPLQTGSCSLPICSLGTYPNIASPLDTNFERRVRLLFEFFESCWSNPSYKETNFSNSSTNLFGQTKHLRKSKIGVG